METGNSFFSDSQKRIISESITQAEKGHHGEIVPLAVSESDLYPAAQARSSLLLGFIVACTSYLISLPTALETYLPFAFVPGLLIGRLLCFIPAWRRLMILDHEREEEVYQRALQAFLENNLHTTHDRNGILIMVSMLERKVQVIADFGIYQKVPKQEWDTIASALATSMKSQDLTKGLEQAIKDCGKLLKAHTSRDSDRVNQFDDQLLDQT